MIVKKSVKNEYFEKYYTSKMSCLWLQISIAKSDFYEYSEMRYMSKMCLCSRTKHDINCHTVYFAFFEHNIIYKLH